MVFLLFEVAAECSFALLAANQRKGGLLISSRSKAIQMPSRRSIDIRTAWLQTHVLLAYQRNSYVLLEKKCTDLHNQSHKSEYYCLLVYDALWLGK
jgi:hypothetical protein